MDATRESMQEMLRKEGLNNENRRWNAMDNLIVAFTIFFLFN
ncbi:hypothetical protein MOC86_17980 [Priestia endophytica]|nr:hypothetical protein [Priestia endophytica]